jgi:hypothetical protein
MFPETHFVEDDESWMWDLADSTQPNPLPVKPVQSGTLTPAAVSQTTIPSQISLPPQAIVHNKIISESKFNHDGSDELLDLLDD